MIAEKNDPGGMGMQVQEQRLKRLGRAPVMEAGCAVLLDINDGDRVVFAHLTPLADVKIGKSSCSLAPLIGCPFGAIFEVQFSGRKPQLHRVQHGSAADKETEAEEDIQEGEEHHGRDNRNLVDDNSAQTLSSEDIDNMRREGLSGKKIIDALIQNSSSFQSKTVFSQEKYLRKKQKKYVPRIITRWPSARTVCEAYFLKSPQKIGYIRSDTLSLLLSSANVGAHADVLVVDLVGGLLTGAVAERLGGYGSICSSYFSSKPPSIDIVRQFNFDESTASSIQRASLADLTDARADRRKALLERESGEPDSRSVPVDRFCESVVSVTPPNGESSDRECPIVNMEDDTQVLGSKDGGVGARAQQPSTGGETPTDAATNLERTNKNFQDVQIEGRGKLGLPKAGRLASRDDIEAWALRGFSSLIVGAPDVDPWSLVQQLLPLLSSSASFAICHPYLQPLADCMQALQAQRMAVALQLFEPWSREYQVLPSRTHPHMQMSATGGYVLSGIRIVAE